MIKKIFRHIKDKFNNFLVILFVSFFVFIVFRFLMEYEIDDGGVFYGDIFLSLFITNVVACIIIFRLLSILNRHYKFAHDDLLKAINNSIYANQYYCYDFVKKKELFSEKFSAFLGSTEDIHTIRDLREIITLDDYTKLDRYIDKAKEARKYDGEDELPKNLCPSIIISTNTKSNETPKIVECSFNIVRNDNNIAIGMFIYFTDITKFSDKINSIQNYYEKIEKDFHILKSSVDVLPIPFWIRSKDLRIIYCNNLYKEIVGFKEGTEILPELSKKSKTIAMEAFSRNQEIEEDTNIIENGNYQPYRIFEYPFHEIRFGDFSTGIAINQAELNHLKHEFGTIISSQSDLMESSSSAIAIFDNEKRLKFYNRVYTKLLGFDEKFLSGNPTYSEILDDLRIRRKLPEQVDFKAFKKQQLDLFTNVTQLFTEFLYLPDGRSIRMLAIPYSAGGMLFSYEDITDRLTIERNYNTLIAVQKSTLNNLRDGVSVYGEDGRLKLHNPMYASIWAIREDLIAKNPHITEVIENVRAVADYTDEEWRIVAKKMVEAILERKYNSLRIKLTNGTWIERICNPMPDGAMMITHKDITDTVRVEQNLIKRNIALQETDKIKTTFLNTISVEFRNPLMTIINSINSLSMVTLSILDSDQREHLESIYNKAQELMVLVNDIVELASIEAGERSLQLEHIELDNFIHDISTDIEKLFNLPGFNFSVRTKTNLKVISLDLGRIKDAIKKIVKSLMRYVNKSCMFVLEITSEDDKEILFTLHVKQHFRSKRKLIDIIEDNIKKDFLNNENLYSLADLGMWLAKRFIEFHKGIMYIKDTEDKNEINICFSIENNMEIEKLDA